MESDSKVWSAFSLLAAIVAAAIARKGLIAAWRLITGKEPPENPADPNVDIGEAVTWAVASGVIIGVARMLATRRAATYYAQATGEPEAKMPGHV
jgi:hypothetical protein